jgi:predicted dehydrogenase
MEPMRIGIIGCGNISEAYLNGAARSKLVSVLGVADISGDAARLRADQFGVPARDIEDLLADREIELVLNLTIPAAHAPVDLDIIDAGKHVYSEKPLAVTAAEAAAMMRAAAAKGVRVGCAPDTFMGAGHQACRRAIDEGRIGDVLSGAVTVMSHGMEHWHPNPGFFFKRGGGPVHDIGPYYVTQLVNLLGPVARVSAEASIGNATRIVTSEPLNGTVIEVEVPTTVTGVMAFASGAMITLSMSWDVWKHRRLPIEIYGREGSLLNPDPNFFGGEPMISARDAEWAALPIEAHPFHARNRTLRSGMEVADYRIIGLLDMAVAIRTGRSHRASGEMALHVLEVLDAFERSALEGRHVRIESTCERPAPLGLGEGEAVLVGYAE